MRSEYSGLLKLAGLATPEAQPTDPLALAAIERLSTH